MSDLKLSSSDVIFLKLGGSLITDKNTPYTARLDILDQSAKEIAEFVNTDPNVLLLIGHGGGSYGHMAAQEYARNHHSKSVSDWDAFQKIHQAMLELNYLVILALQKYGLRPATFSPLVSATAENGVLTNWNMDLIQRSWQDGYSPVTFGDIVTDKVLGGSIVSTEEIFTFLAPRLNAAHILLAGKEPGVMQETSGTRSLVKTITPKTLPDILHLLQQTEYPDVTGGMLAKVKRMVKLVENQPSLTCSIFSGEDKGSLREALLSKTAGTIIRYSE